MGYAGVGLSVIGAASVLVTPLPIWAQAQPLTGERINDIARNITVLIVGKDSHGSGAIISRAGSTYADTTTPVVVTPPLQPDTRDRIENINSILNTVNTGVGVMHSIFGF